MAESLTLRIPMRTPSLNSWQRWHWSRRQRLKRIWIDELGAAVLAQPYPVRERWCLTPKEARVVTITRSFRGRPLDKDNAYGGVKVLLDACRVVGLIVDDSPAWCALTVTQVQNADPWTRVEIAPKEG